MYFPLTFQDKCNRTVVIDFPWEPDPNSGFIRMKHTGVAKKEHYEYMSDQEILDFPINDFAANDCDLFVWTVMRKFRFTFDVIRKWGFKVVEVITWDKELGTPVNGFQRKCEWCLYAYRGKKGISKSGKFIPTIIREKRTKHSQKPDSFYELLKTNTLEPRIDLFARKRHDGFDVYGDQVEPMKQEALFH